MPPGFIRGIWEFELKKTVENSLEIFKYARAWMMQSKETFKQYRVFNPVCVARNSKPWLS